MIKELLQAQMLAQLDNERNSYTRLHPTETVEKYKMNKN